MSAQTTLTAEQERRIRALADDRLIVAVLDCTQREADNQTDRTIHAACAVVFDERDRRGIG